MRQWAAERWFRRRQRLAVCSCGVLPVEGVAGDGVEETEDGRGRLRRSFYRATGEKKKIRGRRREGERKKKKMKGKVAAGAVDGLMVAGACWRWTGGSTGLQGEERS